MKCQPLTYETKSHVYTVEFKMALGKDKQTGNWHLVKIIIFIFQQANFENKTDLKPLN